MWLLALLILTGCSGIPVATDYDANWNFSQAKTYAWLASKEKLIIDPLVDNDLTDGRIQRALEASLAAKGLQKTDDPLAADLLVSYHVNTKERLNITNYHSYFGYYPYFGYPYPYGHGYGYMGPSVDVDQYTAGTFVVDIINPTSKHLLWRGVSERRLQTGGSPQEREQYIRQTIGAIVEQFPPF
jgi:hypothetical protein